MNGPRKFRPRCHPAAQRKGTPDWGWLCSAIEKGVILCSRLHAGPVRCDVAGREGFSLEV